MPWLPIQEYGKEALVACPAANGLFSASLAPPSPTTIFIFYSIRLSFYE